VPQELLHRPVDLHRSREFSYNSVDEPQGHGAGEEAADEEPELQTVSVRDGAAEEAAESKSVDLPDGGQWQVTCDEDACEVGFGRD